MTIFRVSFVGSDHKARSKENEPFKQMARDAKIRAIHDGFDNLTDGERQLVMAVWLADELDDRARARTPSLVIRVGPWILGGGALGAVMSFVQRLGS